LNHDVLSTQTEPATPPSHLRRVRVLVGTPAQYDWPPDKLSKNAHLQNEGFKRNTRLEIRTVVAGETPAASPKGRSQIATIRQLLDEKGHDVITVGANEPVADALRKMADANVGSLVVCEGTKVVGIITVRHYARNVFLEGRALPNTCVKDVMETPVLFVRPELSAEECMAVMTYKRVRYLPVIDDGRLVGIVSLGDLVKNIVSNHQFTIDQLTH
jgi:CBS domain-containing protein